MSVFKSLNSKVFTTKAQSQTPDSAYWKRLGSLALVKEFGAIDYIDFSSVEPYNFAVTCSVRVQIYNPTTRLVAKNLSSFQECAYGGTFRKDGRILLAGDEEGFVKLFDVNSKSILRLFKGHTGPVHRTSFLANNVQVASFSDDKTVRVWDISAEKVVNSFGGHSDYVRAGVASPVADNIIVSGDYAGQIRVFDTRSTSTITEMNHGNPIESVLMLPSGIVASCGGTEIRLWDILNGGKLITKISQHHKTVTCLRMTSDGRRLLSGGLDRHVKVYDIANYNVVHSMRYPNSILSMGISKNDEFLVCGMVDGMVSIQRMESEEKTTQRGDEDKKVFEPRHVDVVVQEPERPLVSKYETSLRKFEYSKALDQVLLTYVANKTPEVTVAVIHELMRRKGLTRALSHRSHASLAKILRFLIRYISDYRFTRVLIDATNILLDCYSNQFQEIIVSDLAPAFSTLLKKLKQEERVTYECLQVAGALEMLIKNGVRMDTERYPNRIELCNETYSIGGEPNRKALESLEQSDLAKRHEIINVK